MSPDSGNPAYRADGRAEHVTATGWRVVGKAVSLIAQSEQVALAAGDNSNVLWAARFRARPRVGTASVVSTIVTELGRAVSRDWHDAPPLLPERPLTRAPARFHGLRWEPSPRSAGEAGSWRGELLWRHPHPVVAGAPCTTHVVIEENFGHTALSIRVTADGGLNNLRSSVAAGQARPAFLQDLNRSLRLSFDGSDTELQTLTREEIGGFVRDVLLSEEREHPIAVLAPLEEGGYAVPSAELAEELTGLAHLYVIDRHPTTFVLTDTVGDKRLSCYWGALRVYMPEFSCADRPENHPLLVRERLADPVIRAGLVGTLGMFAGQRAQLQSVFVAPESGRSEVRATPAPVPAVEQRRESVATPSADAAIAGTESSGTRPISANAPTPDGITIEALRLFAPMPSVLESLGTQIGTLAETIRGLVASNAALRDEIERLRTTTAVRSASTGALERRIGGLEELLSARLPAPESIVPSMDAIAPAQTNAGIHEEAEEEGETPSLVDALRQAATNYSDALLVLDAAERSAEESPFEDVDRLAVILDAMAAVARRRQEGALGTSLKEAFRDVGIDYRGGITPATSDKHRRQYLVRVDGQVYDCHEHIVLGKSYDPRYCLRVYFTSRAPLEPRFVIGHVGRHFDVASTS